MLFVHAFQDAQRTGHADAEPTKDGRIEWARTAGVKKSPRIGCGRRGLAPIQRLKPLPRGIPVEEKGAAAEPGGLGFHQVQDELHGHRRVGGAAALPQDLKSRLGRIGICRHQHVTLGPDDALPIPPRCGLRSGLRLQPHEAGARTANTSAPIRAHRIATRLGAGAGSRHQADRRWFLALAARAIICAGQTWPVPRKGRTPVCTVSPMWPKSHNAAAIVAFQYLGLCPKGCILGLAAPHSALRRAGRGAWDGVPRIAGTCRWAPGHGADGDQFELSLRRCSPGPRQDCPP